MWIYQLLICASLLLCSDAKRNPLQDYQKSDGVRLVGPAEACQSKTRRLSLGKCARRCHGNWKLPCRAFGYDHKNRRCHLLAADSVTPGVRVESDFNFDLYEKKDYVRECIVGTGQSYKGRRSLTQSGVECQRWALLIPHDHDFLPKKNKKKDLRENLCRNPDNATTGPWCFTVDPVVRLQGCGVPQCSEVECVSCNGESYRGPMDHTESGRECQRWDLDEPHRHTFHPKWFPGQGLKDNFCRNPNGRHRPWCYTTDPSVPWEYCSIKECESVHAASDTTTSCYHGRGEGYRGTVGVTPGGVICQRWDSQFPHQHSFTPQNYRCKDLRENYCRNPDGRDLPWCFTTDPNVPVASCTNIPRCGAETTDPEECYEGAGDRYRGNVSKTRSGIPCATWRGHSESKNLGVAELSIDSERTYCRNPDGDKHGPWCYTNDSLTPWDYCMIKPCETSRNNLPQNADPPRPSCFVHKTVRIVGGSPVPITEGSWMVSIQKGNLHWCGGSLVREEWVLTDRQCFSSCVPDLSEYKVWLGTAHLNQSQQGRFQRQEVQIAHIICGPEGSGLALLRLSEPALPSEHIRNIQLPVAGCGIPEGTMCAMYGWGETKGTGHEGTLKMVRLPVVSNEKCRENHRGNLQITSSRLCAGGRKDEGVCEKDYGGPLVCQERESKVIVGVSVHGRGCARHNRPGIFVNVAFYTEWIHKVYKHYPNLNY
ncbi:hepatocyte growth factor [Denticeps clupeoides]|uniref:Hepatocyte growth factor n=1 Tax=Denticeps clupeoides TaxID=299321 RepID=A0AAY4CY11_9TELE|nr:hepatocyte growth factor-like [Denticeps clupeoides]